MKRSAKSLTLLVPIGLVLAMASSGVSPGAQAPSAVAGAAPGPR
jgi:hypothetical protein